MANSNIRVLIALTDEERAQLTSMARSRSLPAAMVLRARIVLACEGENKPTSEVADEVRTSRTTVVKWRARYAKHRLQGLYDEVRPGRPRTVDDERVAELVTKTLHTKPADGSTHWSTRTLALETGISKSSVARYLQAFQLKPHRVESFKLSTDPFFIEKLRDVVGLYLTPRRTRWCCALTRRANARRSSVRSRCCPWAWDTSRASRTTMSGTELRRCSLR